MHKLKIMILRILGVEKSLLEERYWGIVSSNDTNESLGDMPYQSLSDAINKVKRSVRLHKIPVTGRVYTHYGYNDVRILHKEITNEQKR